MKNEGGWIFNMASLTTGTDVFSLLLPLIGVCYKYLF